MPGDREIAGVRETSSATMGRVRERFFRPWRNVYASGDSWEAAGVKNLLDCDPTVLGTIFPSTIGKQMITLDPSGISELQSWVDSP